MRRITIPLIDWSQLEGVRAIVPVKVDWPEVQLTLDQVLANAIADVNDADPPYPDNSIIEVVIPRPFP